MTKRLTAERNWEPPFKWVEGEERPFIVIVAQLNARGIEKLLIRMGISRKAAYDISTAIAGVGLI